MALFLAALLLAVLTSQCSQAQHYQSPEHFQDPVEAPQFQPGNHNFQQQQQPFQAGQFQLVTKVFTLPDGSITTLQVPQQYANR